MAGMQDQLFQVHLIISEASGGFRFGLREGSRQDLRTVAAPDAPSAPACGRFQEDRIAYGFCRGQGFLHGIRSLAADLAPAFRMALPEGPIKVRPSSAQASEKSAFSERKP